MLKKTNITEEELLSHVDDASIFHKYFGEFNFNKTYSSVFRKDTNPSTCFVTANDGRVIYKDFGSGEKLNAVAFVSKLYGTNYGKTINKIAKDFGLIPDGKGEIAKPVRLYKPAINTRSKHYHVTVGKYTQRELDYWKQFHISEKELLDNFVYPVRTLIIDDYEIPNPENLLKFAYVINAGDDEQYIKIYTPESKQFKWQGTMKNWMIFGLMELPYTSDTLIITKGQKDRIIFKKFFTDVIAVQHEAAGAMPEHVAEMINANYKHIYVNFDVDKQFIREEWHYIGKEEGTKLCKKYGWKWINVPDEYYIEEGIKDFADLVKIKGLTMFKKYLKWKGLLDS